MNIPVLNQRDPQFVDMNLGFSTARVGVYGCLFMCAAMIAYHDQPVPVRADLDLFMAAMKAKGNYSPQGGDILQSFDFGAAAPKAAGAITLVDLSASWPGRIPDDLLALLHARLDAPAYNAAGNTACFAIIEVDNRGDALTAEPHENHQHFVVMTDSDGTIHDPWYGDVANITRYGHDQTHAIWRWIAYDVKTAYAPANLYLDQAKSMFKVLSMDDT